MSRKKVEHKTALTFEEKITAAHLHYVQGVDQHVIAFAYHVNPGRVAEACVAIRNVLKDKDAKHERRGVAQTDRNSGQLSLLDPTGKA